MTNKEFAIKCHYFRAACKRAGVDPTAAQASHWRSKKGAAWSNGRLWKTSQEKQNARTS